MTQLDEYRADQLLRAERADRRVRTACLLILAIVALGVTLYWLRPVLVPFVFAVLFTYCIIPLVDLQMKYLRVPRVVALIITAVLGALILAVIGFAIGAAVGEMSRNFGQYRAQLDQFTHKIAAAIPLERFGIVPDPTTGQIFRLPEDATSDFVAQTLNEVRLLLSNGVLVVIFMIFILSGRPRGRLGPPPLLNDIQLRVKQYIRVTILISSLTGILVASTLAILGVPFAGLFGLLAFLLNFIPTIGSIIATLLPLPLILLNADMSLTAKVLAITIPAAIQTGLGILQPKLQGESVGLHPVTVLMALIFFGMIWGPAGAFLATPIAAVIKIILEQTPATEPLARILAGDLDVLVGRRKPGTYET